MADAGPRPDWENSDRWDEREWEQALQYSDDMAARYFRMLDRYGDLPDAEELIAARLGDQQLFEIEEPEFLQEEGWGFDDTSEIGEPDAEGEGDSDGDGDGAYDEQMGPGDTLYFETCPVYQKARQVALGWCNILASVLQPEDRFWGMKVLFHMGRILSYLSLSVGDGTYERVTGSISFAKRALAEINTILGELDAKTRETPKYATMFRLIRELVLDNRELVVTHLFECRKRAGGEFPAE
jgi:hypothetical protein